MEFFWIDVALYRSLPSRKMQKTVLIAFHTFFRDIQLPQSQFLELLEQYRLCTPAQYIPGTTEKLLENLINFRRQLFSRKHTIFFPENLKLQQKRYCNFFSEDKPHKERFLQNSGIRRYFSKTTFLKPQLLYHCSQRFRQAAVSADERQYEELYIEKQG